VGTMKRAGLQLAIDRTATSGLTGVVLGLFLGFSDDGDPLVDYPGNPAACAIPARSTAVLTEQDRGRDAALLFESGDPARPILVGLVQAPIEDPPRLPAPKTAVHLGSGGKVEAQVDGKRLEIRAEDEIVLRCGEASVTLRRNGRVIIRGTYVETRSKGVNRIKGGSVLIN
jgi:hypothetical protein